MSGGTTGGRATALKQFGTDSGFYLKERLTSCEISREEKKRATKVRGETEREGEGERVK